MTTESALLEPPEAPAEPTAPPPAETTTRSLLDRVTRTVAPLWPLESFVAVNPYLGYVDRPFADVANIVGRTAGSRLTMPRSFYAKAIRSGRIQDRHLEAALAEARQQVRRAGIRDPGLPAGVQGCKQIAFGPEPPAIEPTPTVVDVASRITGQDWARLVTDRISTWACAYFDQGQALWRSPWRGLSPYRAWHAEACLDRTPEVLGVKAFRSAVKKLSADPAVAVDQAIERLGVSGPGLEAYLRRLLMTIGGWAAYARYQVWQSELYGGANAALEEVLTIRLAWDALMYEAFPSAHAAWRSAREAIVAPVGAAADYAVDRMLQAAYEKAWQEGMVARLSERPASEPRPAPAVQAVFCIDVRSEVLRRALESVSTGIETIGFAGFFGFPVEVTPLGRSDGGAYCPVLLTPGATVRETVRGGDADVVARAAVSRNERQRTNAIWKTFKLGAVSCFGFVETMGLAFAPKMITDTFGWTRPVPHPDVDGIDRKLRGKLGPTLAVERTVGRHTGLDDAGRLAMAEGMLAGMSLKDGFGRLVLLVGHGSTTTNNPHAAGLECGACGGHSGAANARIAADTLNDSAVRAGLAAKGIRIPDQTVFLAGLHDTATDEVTLFDTEAAAETHRAELDALRYALHAAARIVRRERAPNLRVAADRSVDAAVIGRSRDWSQVRPEWGLAGCAAFIVAPRHRTQGVDLGGRAFLHSYDWRQDVDCSVLELIMTAPMVVASWINLQYYGSTVDNRTFGSGNKTLHNVVGALGVLEGNSGDLRPGLPLQSVHDGERFVHEPMRLNVVIEAPLDAINGIIRKHESVRHLFDHEWLHLWAFDDDGRIAHRYVGGLRWESVTGEPKQAAPISGPAAVPAG